MPWSWGTIASNSGNPYTDSNRSGILPTPLEFLARYPYIPETQSSHQYGRPYFSQRSRPQYNHHHQGSNRGHYNGGFRPYQNQRHTYQRMNGPRWNSSVTDEYAHRRQASPQNPPVNNGYNRGQKPNNHDSMPTCENIENLPNTEGVKMQKLPFLDVKSNLLQIDVINQGSIASHHYFFFKQEELEDLLRNKENQPYKVQLRICKLDSSSEQEDYYPGFLQIAVNNNLCILPGIDSIPRGPARPINITFMCNLMGRNDIAVRNADTRNMENLKIFVQLVKKLTSQELIDRLKAKSPIKPEDTACQIKEKLQEDQTGDEIASTTFPCSLLCPLSKTRMKLPCRASSCSHFQCFDAVTYLQMNELKPKWSCPVCSEPAIYDHLLIDGYFKAVVEQNISCDKIVLLADGSWNPLQSSDKRQLQPIADCGESSVNVMASTLDKTVVLDSDGDSCNYDCQDVTELSEGEGYSMEGNAAGDLSSSVMIITLSDDESFISSSQTNNHMFGFCSTPQTSSIQTRGSSGVHDSHIQNSNAAQASQPILCSTPHRYTPRSFSASFNSSHRKRFSSEKSPKRRNKTNSSINSCWSNSIVSIHNDSLNSSVDSHGNSDSECPRRESRTSISSGSDTTSADATQQRSSDHHGMPGRAGLVQRKARGKTKHTPKKQKKLKRLRKYSFRRSRGKNSKHRGRRNVI
ncbi:uncharacterized protein [Panulirus ornatus]|uniref:uncharacterized protein isoform X1 n=1 Tax=Panulirus ornatus TaxID=150431 RepID=UPI003A89BA1F